MSKLSIKPVWLLAFCLWIGLVAGSYAWLLRYSFAAGDTSAVPCTIPPSLLSPGTPARPQLLLALHPRCPCSRATVKELAKILTHAPNACNVTALMYRPAGEPDNWLDGALLDACRRMNCQVRPDPDGRLAGLVGSLTSGNVVLYDASGKLRYHGGITSSRGHEGDNAGERAVIQILRGNRDSQKSMPVFGCPIRPETTRQDSL